MDNYDAILSSRGSLTGPFAVWGHSPELANQTQHLGEYVRFHSRICLIISTGGRSPWRIGCRRKLNRPGWLIAEILTPKKGLTTPIEITDAASQLWGTLTKVQGIVTQGQLTPTTSSDDTTSPPPDPMALVDAVAAGDHESLRHLLAAGANPNARNGDNVPVLTLAISAEDANAVQALLDAGVDPNGQISTGATPLMFAAYRGNVGLVQALLDNGADVNLRDNQGFTALMAAAETGAVDAMQLLLNAGAEVNVHLGCIRSQSG